MNDMDTREMVEQITREVLARMKEAGGTPAAGAAAPGAPAKPASGQPGPAPTAPAVYSIPPAAVLG